MRPWITCVRDEPAPATLRRYDHPQCAIKNSRDLGSASSQLQHLHPSVGRRCRAAQHRVGDAIGHQVPQRLMLPYAQQSDGRRTAVLISARACRSGRNGRQTRPSRSSTKARQPPARPRPHTRLRPNGTLPTRRVTDRPRPSPILVRPSGQPRGTCSPVRVTNLLRPANARPVPCAGKATSLPSSPGGRPSSTGLGRPWASSATSVWASGTG